MAECCPTQFSGFCLSDGTPIIVVVDGMVQIGWINVLTGVFSPGPPPVGTVSCEPLPTPLDCLTDSITVCPPASGFNTVIVDSVGSCSCHAEADTSNVAASITTVTLLPAFADRKGAIFWNDSISTAYLKFGAGASTSDFTWKLASQSGYELPSPVYWGLITAVWDSANGFMFVTEMI